MPPKNVVVLAGGFSPERNVSLASGANVAATLRRRGHRALFYDLSSGPIAPSAEEALLRGPIANAPDAAELAELERRTDVLEILRSTPFRDTDLIFPVIHGAFGEDGRLAAVLAAAKLPFVGGDALGQALAMNKHLAKQLFRQLGVPTAEWIHLRRGAPNPAPDAARFPLIVKPASAGSSLGVSACASGADWTAALERAFAYDDEVVAESLIVGREFTIGILEGRALALGEIRAAGDRFDYEAKYRAAATQEIFPAPLPAAVAEKAAAIAVAAAAALRQRHYCRVDFMLDARDQVWVLEVNSAPGMTQKSLFPQSAAAVGLSFADVCERLCALALGALGESRAASGA